MRYYVPILLAAFAISAAPLRAESSADPGDLFVNAYMDVQQGEKAEQNGNFKAALSKFREAANVLDQISTRYPSWQPQIVDYRKTRTADGIARMQEKIAHAGGGQTDVGGNQPGGLPGLEPQPPLPQHDNEKPLALEDTPVPPPSKPGSRTAPRHGAPRASDNEAVQEVSARMKNLEADLKAAKDEAQRLQKEKADLAQKLEDAAKARAASDQKQKALQDKADNAEKLLAQAMAEGKGDSEQIKALQADAAATKRALRVMRIEAEADSEYRKQLDDRFKFAMAKIAQLTQDLGSATQSSQSVPGKIEGIQKQLDQVRKEKDDLQAKLQTAETQLQKVTVQRDEALSQVAKLQDAQKQVEKLVADNAALMDKLKVAERTINQFKIEGEEKDKQIASLKEEVTTVRGQLAAAKKESADYQRQMADLQSKLEDSGKQLAAAKAENVASAADKKKMMEENTVLRGIVLRQQKEEAHRVTVKKAVLGELKDLEIHSKSLLKEIELLGGPVVMLSDKEKSLFKKAELQVSDTEISIGAPAAAAASPEPAKPPAVPESAPAPVNPPPTVPTPPAPAPVATPAPAPAVQAATPEPATPKSRNAKNKPQDKAKVAEAKPVDTPLPQPDPVGSLSLQVPPPTAPALPPQPSIGDLASNKPSGKAPSSTPDPAAPTTTTPLSEAANIAGGDASRSKTAGNEPNVPPELLPLAREGKEQFERGNYLEAEKTYRRILAKAPNNLYTLSNLGVVLFRAKKHKLAEESFKKAIAVAPEDGFSHCTLGIVYYDQGQQDSGKYDDAVNELTKALAIDSKNATAHNYLGITASQKGWQEAALKELETATALEPNYADAWFNLAVVYATQNPPNRVMAKKCYDKAVTLGAERDSALEQLIK